MLAVKTNIPFLKKALENEFRRNSKDFERALKVTGFKLRRKMQDEIKEGAPGFSRFKPLTYIARGLNIKSGRRLRKNRPLIRLANAVTYKLRKTPETEMRIGFTRRSMPFYRRLAEAHEKGFTQRIGKRLRREIISEGARRMTGHRDAGYVEQTPYFLRKSTKSFKTPPRPIVGPFWLKHRERAWRDIRNRFRRKRAGERI